MSRPNLSIEDSIRLVVTAKKLDAAKEELFQCYDVIDGQESSYGSLNSLEMQDAADNYARAKRELDALVLSA